MNQKQLTPSGIKGNLLAAESFLRWLKDQGKDHYDIDPDTMNHFTEHPWKPQTYILAIGFADASEVRQGSRDTGTVHPHSFRHNGITWWLDAGIDVEVVSRGGVFRQILSNA